MSDTNKRRLTISLDPGTFAKLPRINKSLFVEDLLRQHFLIESGDKLYNYLINRMKKDGYIGHTENMINSGPVVRTYQPCCGRYPDLDCGHWVKSEDATQAINKRNGEVREIGQW